jgi:hypothetical protein
VVKILHIKSGGDSKMTMNEEDQLKTCIEVFEEDWATKFPEEEDVFLDKEKFRFLSEEKGIEMSMIWKAYRSQYRGKRTE